LSEGKTLSGISPEIILLQVWSKKMVKMTKKLKQKLLYCPECGKYVKGMVYENIFTIEVNFWKCKEDHKIINLN
jgi:hypothetical protein